MSPTPESVSTGINRAVAGYQPGFKPQGVGEQIGAIIGENAPTVAAQALSPGIGGPLAFMAQQAAETGKVSPIPMLSTVKAMAEIPLFQKGMKAIGRGLSGGIEKTTGIPSEATETAFKKPTALFTAPNQKEVSAAYANSEFPEMTKDLHTMIQEGTGSYAGTVKRGANALTGYVENGTKNPAAILEGRKGLDKQLALLQNQIDASRGPGRSALLSSREAKLTLRGMFNRALDKMSPKLREADALASERLGVAPFRNFTLPGKINFLSPEGIARAVPGLPTAIGLVVSGAGGAAKTAGGILNASPSINSMAIGNLTKEKVREFLDQANGNRDLARQLAKKAGYSW
jgi:hypothetical protein